MNRNAGQPTCYTYRSFEARSYCISRALVTFTLCTSALSDSVTLHGHPVPGWVGLQRFHFAVIPLTGCRGLSRRWLVESLAFCYSTTLKFSEIFSLERSILSQRFAWLGAWVHTPVELKTLDWKITRCGLIFLWACLGNTPAWLDKQKYRCLAWWMTNNFCPYSADRLSTWLKSGGASFFQYFS